uniref:Uncharacterized protein n=1 Tax=Macrostomum lignano TaxID=282301 RepID=A0A1I8FAI5_9PLAT
MSRTAATRTCSLRLPTSRVDRSPSTSPAAPPSMSPSAAPPSPHRRRHSAPPSREQVARPALALLVL